MAVWCRVICWCEIIESSKNAFDVFTNLKTAEGLKWMCIFLIMDAGEDQLWQIVLFITVSLDCSFNVCNLQNPEHHHLSFLLSLTKTYSGGSVPVEDWMMCWHTSYSENREREELQSVWQTTDTAGGSQHPITCARAVMPFTLCLV